MSDLEIIIRDLINFTNPDLKDEYGIVDGLVGSLLHGYQKMIFEDGKLSFSMTQKGIEYVESMPFHKSEDAKDG